MAHAFTEGIRRVLSAPVLLLVTAVASLFSPLHPTTASRRVLVEFVLVGSFLAGGAIDRYARARPTRATGFFGAGGRHLAAMLRLAAIEILLYLACDNMPDVRAALALAAGVNLIGVYARVRLVVEDRRSAFGALLGSVRFIRRNPAAIAVYAVWMTALVATGLYARGAAPILLLPLVGSATVFFQSRLAHAGYAAAPPVEWPESPAAEALSNRDA